MVDHTHDAVPSDAADELEILSQGPGYTIAKTKKATTMVPYHAVGRGDGSRNYGWVDLRDRPEFVDAIPEVANRPGLAAILRVAAAKNSPLMTGASEAGAFANPPDREFAWHVGGFATLMYRDSDLNSEAENLVQLAVDMLRGVSVTDDHVVCYEMIIEPLKGFFDRTDCHCLTVKPVGYGRTEEEAFVAFNEAAAAVATSILGLHTKAADRTLRSE